MARVSIYVSDDLKARMVDTGVALNWSDIARSAFEAAIAAFNHRKGQNMQTAIERLRASKMQHESQEAESGKAAGRSWGSNHAEFGDLKRIGEIDVLLYFDEPDLELPPSNRTRGWLHLSKDELARRAHAEPAVGMVFVVVGDPGANPRQNGVGVGAGLHARPSESSSRFLGV